MRITHQAVRQLLAKRAYERVTPEYYPVGFVPEEPEFVTGYGYTEGDCIERLVQAADVWSWV